MANIRAAYAEVVTNGLTGGEKLSIDVPLTSDTTNWKSDAATIGDKKVAYSTLIGSDNQKASSITVTYDDGKITVGSTIVQE